MTITITTQAELDAALATDDHQPIIIDSLAGVWLTITDNHRHPVRAGDSATVRAGGSATVKAWGSATVEAWDSATVKAGGSATVEAWDSATVKAWGSATVEAGGSATVKAGGSATVEAWDSATVRAWDSATVRATPYVAVHLHSAQATIHGGVIIDITGLELTDPQTWCAYHGVEVDDEGWAHLYKAVDDQLVAGHQWVPTAYTLGADITPDVWRDDHDCGGGLHACPRPSQARDHYPDATRYLEVTCPVDQLRPIDDTKAKAPRLHVLREVDLMVRHRHRRHDYREAS